MTSSRREDLLLDLYRVAIDEYRFEVRLGWERTSQLLTLDSGLLAANVGLIQLGDDKGRLGSAALVAVVGLLGVGVSLLGILIVIASRAYYERTKVKKTFVEKRLGLLQPHPDHASALTNLAVTTTEGMADVDAMLEDPEAWLAHRHFRWRRRTITNYTAWLFALLAVVHGAVSVVVLASAWFSTQG